MNQCRSGVEPSPVFKEPKAAANQHRLTDVSGDGGTEKSRRSDLCSWRLYWGGGKERDHMERTEGERERERGVTEISCVQAVTCNWNSSEVTTNGLSTSCHGCHFKSSTSPCFPPLTTFCHATGSNHGSSEGSSRAYMSDRSVTSLLSQPIRGGNSPVTGFDHTVPTGSSKAYYVEELPHKTARCHFVLNLSDKQQQENQNMLDISGYQISKQKFLWAGFSDFSLEDVDEKKTLIFLTNNIIK